MSDLRLIKERDVYDGVSQLRVGYAFSSIANLYLHRPRSSVNPSLYT